MIGAPELAAELGRALGDQSRVTSLSPATLADDTGRSALVDALAGVTRVLFAPSAASDSLSAAAGYDVFHAGRRLSAALASIATPPRLYLLTRNAQPVNEGDRANAVHAVLWGLGRTLALEHPEFWGRVVDVDETVPTGLVATYLLRESAGRRHRGSGGLPRGTSPRTPTAPQHPDRVRAGRTRRRRLPSGHRCDRQHRPAPGPAAREDGCAHRRGGVPQPGLAFDDLTGELAKSGTALVTVAADSTDPAAMGELFARLGADLPPLHGIYLAAFGGGPVTLADMTDADVTAMFAPKLDALAVVHPLSVHQPVRQFVLFLLDLGPDRVALAGALHRHQHIPGHLRLCAAGGRPAGHHRQLGSSNT